MGLEWMSFVMDTHACERRQFSAILDAQALERPARLASILMPPSASPSLCAGRLHGGHTISGRGLCRQHPLAAAASLSTTFCRRKGSDCVTWVPSPHLPLLSGASPISLSLIYIYIYIYVKQTHIFNQNGTQK